MRGNLIWRTLIVMCTLTLGACNDNGNVVDFLCGDVVIVDREIYDVTSSSDYTIIDVTVSGSCVTIEISASGCDARNWDVSLIDSGLETLSLPPMRSVKLSLINQRDCLAVFQRSYTFDMRPVLTSETETIILNLEGWNDQIVING